ncbi:MAG: peptide deformylase [Spirochaetes bacterium]|nr:peptide deformylase [Spirochaetota bacterium]
MAKKKIITYGDNKLWKPSEQIKNIDHRINRLIQDMFDTLNDHKGIGLAAIQIGIPKRIIVIDTSTVDQDDFNIKKPLKIAIINPEITETSEREEIKDEGCLSVPGISAPVKRYFTICIKGWTIEEKEIKLKLFDLNARVAQHEIDHINGCLFVEKIDKEIYKNIEDDLRRLKIK